MDAQFTKIATNLLLGVRDLAEWGIDSGNTTAENLRLTVAARKEVAVKLVESGMSQRNAAKILGVTHKTIQNDLAKKSPKNGDEFATAIEKATATRRANEAERKKRFEKPALDLPSGLYQGDFRELSPQKIADDSVDLVFTDPPYHRDTAALYEHAAREAARILKPGGSMICYCGHLILPQVLPRMMSHLKYFWIGAHVHDGGPMSTVREYGIVAGFKPLLWFVKKYRADKQGLIADTVLVKREKDTHEWQQAVATAEHFIRGLTSDSGLVVDFFAGGGTTIVAAKNVGCQWVAFEIDAESVAKIVERIK